MDTASLLLLCMIELWLRQQVFGFFRSEDILFGVGLRFKFFTGDIWLYLELKKTNPLAV